MFPHLGRMAAVAVTVLGLSACGGDGPTASDGPDPAVDRSAPAGAEPQGLLAWMARHPENAGLVVLPETGAAELGLSSDRRFPLASTRKVLILGALIQSGERLSATVPRSAVERFYAPGTDGGAHEKAGLDAPRLTLKAVAQAMIEESDNAAADALLDRVGPDAVDAFAEQQGMENQDPIYPLLGKYAAWMREPKWAELSPPARAQHAAELARDVRGVEVKVPAIDEQRRLAASSVAGTPAEWAALMRDIARAGDPQLIDLLDWQRRTSSKTAKSFTRLLFKAGSLPGVLTQAAYVQPRGGPGVAVALFLRDLPPDLEQTLMRTASQDKLLLRLASDPAFRKQAGEVLEG